MRIQSLEITERLLFLSESPCLDDSLRSIHDRRETDRPARDHQPLEREIASLDRDGRTRYPADSRAGGHTRPRVDQVECGVRETDGLEALQHLDGRFEMARIEDVVIGHQHEKFRLGKSRSGG